MPGAGDGALGGREHRIAGDAAVRAGHALGAGGDHTVVHIGAALRGEQEIRAADPVEVRSLRPPRVRTAPRPQDVLGPGEPAFVGQVLPHPDLGAAGGLVQHPGGGEPGPPVAVRPVVEEQRRVEARAVQPVRLRPRPRRVGRRDDEMAGAVHQRAHEVEDPVMVPDRRREQAAGRLAPVEVELRRPVQRGAETPPVHQIAAVEHGKPREPFEAGRHQVVVRPHAADGRVGPEAGEYGIAEPAGHGTGTISTGTDSTRSAPG